MRQLAVGREGLLLAADTKAAAIVALATGVTTLGTRTAAIKAVANNRTIAALVGPKAEDILIDDLAVNVILRQAYLAVSRGGGPDAVPLLGRIKADGQPELVSLDDVKFSRAVLPDDPPTARWAKASRHAIRATSRSPPSPSRTAACPSRGFPTKRSRPRCARSRFR
jgi:hypothetical protein